MDGSIYSASMREICRDALEKPNKSSEGRCVLEAGHFSPLDCGPESFRGIADFLSFPGDQLILPRQQSRSVQKLLDAAFRSSLERLSRLENYLYSNL
jgi:hypothetical protein